MKFERTITLSSEYPKRDPPARSVAQLPGSMYPTATRNPGPLKASIFRQKPAPGGIRIERCDSGRLRVESSEEPELATEFAMGTSGRMVGEFRSEVRLTPPVVGSRRQTVAARL